MDKGLGEFFKKEKVTILVTDSGLGGLSVAAHLEANFKKWHPFKEVKIMFVNALPSETYFYNQMKNTAEKVRVFNQALFGMTEKLSPDLIFIACNTLSVLYNQTDKQRFNCTKTSVQVISQAKLSTMDMEAISGMIETVSVPFAFALRNYIWMKDLFTYYPNF